MLVRPATAGPGPVAGAPRQPNDPANPATGRRPLVVGGHDANAGTDTLDVDGQPRPTVLHQDRGDPSAGPPAVDRGFSAGHATDLWPGTIDQVHGWNRVLSAADAAAPYSSGG